MVAQNVLVCIRRELAAVVSAQPEKPAEPEVAVPILVNGDRRTAGQAVRCVEGGSQSHSLPDRHRLPRSCWHCRARSGRSAIHLQIDQSPLELELFRQLSHYCRPFRIIPERRPRHRGVEIIADLEEPAENAPRRWGDPFCRSSQTVSLQNRNNTLLIRCFELGHPVRFHIPCGEPRNSRDRRHAVGHRLNAQKTDHSGKSREHSC